MKKFNKATDTTAYNHNISMEEEMKIPFKNSLDEMEKRRKAFIAKEKLKEKSK